MTRSYIWPIVTRFAHLLLILFFAISYLLGDFEELLSLHVAFGLALAVVLFFRVLWGFVGPKYSRFSDFNFSLKDLMRYLLNPFSKTKEYIGHNPASSWAIVAMFVVGFLTTISGLLLYGIQENHGIFAFLHNSFYRDMEFLEDAHELFANLFVAIVLVHIAGSLLDKFVKNGDAIDSMISGYKKTKNKIVVELNLFQKIFAIIWIGVSLFSLYYLIFTNNIFVATHYEKQDYAALHSDFVEECASCHIIYPPYLLPKKSWEIMMSDLENHFGDDASLDDETNLSILNFLKQRSAENSTHQAAFGILKSLKDRNDTIIAISQTPYWKEIHKDIDEKIYKSEQVKSRANCAACHVDFEKGLLENHLIKMPKVEK